MVGASPRLVGSERFGPERVPSDRSSRQEIAQHGRRDEREAARRNVPPQRRGFASLEGRSGTDRHWAAVVRRRFRQRSDWAVRGFAPRARRRLRSGWPRRREHSSFSLPHSHGPGLRPNGPLQAGRKLGLRGRHRRLRGDEQPGRKRRGQQPVCTPRRTGRTRARGRCGQRPTPGGVERGHLDARSLPVPPGALDGFGADLRCGGTRRRLLRRRTVRYPVQRRRCAHLPRGSRSAAAAIRADLQLPHRSHLGAGRASLRPPIRQRARSDRPRHPLPARVGRDEDARRDQPRRPGWRCVRPGRRVLHLEQERPRRPRGGAALRSEPLRLSSVSPEAPDTLTAMRTRTLGPLEVSVVGLGCNNFGRRVDQDGTREVVDAALDAGVSFFDTAESYRGGQSEAFLGHALRGRRERVVLATKFGGGGRVGNGKGSREEIRRALEGSLERLQTDYVDLYQHHQEDPETPLAETIGALDDLVREGKIRAYGTSNYSPERIEEAATLAQEPYVSEQSQYSWLARDAERDLLPTCERLGLGFIPYFPLASGLLTGKYRRGRPAPEGTRLHGQEIGRASCRERV